MSLNIAVNLPTIKLGMIREQNICELPRQRLTGEKYFRQAIQVYNKEGKLVDSGFVQINDYTDMCRMVRICNKYKKNLHFFERWEYYGKDFYKTNMYNIINLSTGNTVDFVLDSDIKKFIKNINDNHAECCCLVGDLEKDEYSNILLECLNEYSKSNEPPNQQAYSKIFEGLEKGCGCNLLEELEINDLFKNNNINEERKDELLESLTCKCQPNTFNIELTEEENAKKTELRLKAQAEIAEVFAKK